MAPDPGGASPKPRTPKPLGEQVLELLYLVGLAAMFFGPLAVINAAPSGTPWMAQVKKVVVVGGGALLYLCCVILVGRIYHRRRDGA